MKFTREALIEDLARELVEIDTSITRAETALEKAKIQSQKSGETATGKKTVAVKNAQGAILQQRANRLAVRKIAYRWGVTTEVDELVSKIMDGEVKL